MNRMGRSLPQDPPEERLFVGVFPAGLVYADTSLEDQGDYKTIAFLPYRTLILEVRDFHSELLPEIRRRAATVQAMRGQPYQVSTCGQTVMLGEDGCREV